MRDHYLNTCTFMWPYSDRQPDRIMRIFLRQREREREMGNLLKDLQITEVGRGIELGRKWHLAWKNTTFTCGDLSIGSAVSRTAGAPDIPVISMAFAAFAATACKRRGRPYMLTRLHVAIVSPACVLLDFSSVSLIASCQSGSRLFLWDYHIDVCV